VGAAASARELADAACALVGQAHEPQPTRQRIRDVRQIRVLALELLDRTVLAQLLAGASWAEVAEALMLPEDLTRSRYADALAIWSGRAEDAAVSMPGSAGDRDVEGTAAALDAWWLRHAEGASVCAGDVVTDPVSRLLNALP
jgi:hypothetical protein